MGTVEPSARVATLGISKRPLKRNGEQELQRVDVEQDHEEKRGVEDHRREVLEAVPTMVLVVEVPAHHQHEETDGESRELLKGRRHLRECRRHLEGHDEQRQGEREDDVRQPLDTRDVAAPPAEVRLGAERRRNDVLPDHTFPPGSAMLRRPGRLRPRSGDGSRNAPRGRRSPRGPGGPGPSRRAREAPGL